MYQDYPSPRRLRERAKREEQISTVVQALNSELYSGVKHINPASVSQARWNAQKLRVTMDIMNDDESILLT